MQFTLTGFTQEKGCRVFAYEGTAEDRVRINFTVRADLALSRKYGIRLQELPLMCLAILEQNSDGGGAIMTEPADLERDVTFTEEAMIRHSDQCVADREAAALKRTSTRRQPAKTAERTSEYNPYGETAPTPAKPYGQSW